MNVQDLFGYLKPIIEYDYSGLLIVWKTIAFILSLVLLIGIIHNVWKLNIASRIWREKVFGTTTDDVYNLQGKTFVQKAREKWDKILTQGTSEDENERKMALIAADSLVDNILKSVGYDGENLGERLKQIEKADLTSLDALWEAHKIRNRIAHEADYRLTKEDAFSALTNYGKALRELNYI
jgi:hypothetical protein